MIKVEIRKQRDNDVYVKEIFVFGIPIFRLKLIKYPDIKELNPKREINF